MAAIPQKLIAFTGDTWKPALAVFAGPRLAEQHTFALPPLRHGSGVGAESASEEVSPAPL